MKIQKKKLCIESMKMPYKIYVQYYFQKQCILRADNTTSQTIRPGLIYMNHELFFPILLWCAGREKSVRGWNKKKRKERRNFILKAE